MTDAERGMAPQARGPRRALAVHAIGGGAEGDALLHVPALSIKPLYPGGFFPLLRPATDGEGAAAWMRMAWDDALAAADASAGPAARADGAGIALLAGDVDAARERAADVGQDADDDARFRASLVLAIADAVEGEADAALARLDDLESTDARRDDERLVYLLANRAAAELMAGRADLAEAAALEALRAGRRRKDDYRTAVGGLAAALAHLARGRRGDARTRLGDAVRGFARAGDVLRQVQCHHLLGEVAYDGEDPIRAGSHYRDALALARPAEAHAAIDLLTLRFEHR